MGSSDLSILIPTYNEEKNIGRLIERIKEILPDSPIIVIDDGSEDQTQNIVQSFSYGVTLIDRSEAPIKGLSISIKEGIQHTITEYFMVIDGDFQHPPDSLLEALTCTKNNTDMIIGFRLKVENWPFMRKLMSWGAQNLAYISLLLRRRKRPKDIMSGFFGGKTTFVQDLLRNTNISDRGYKILFDILKVLPRDSEICQFGYVFKNREYGDSKIGRIQILEFVKSLF